MNWFFGASNNSGSPAGGGGVPPHSPPPPPHRTPPFSGKLWELVVGVGVVRSAARPAVSPCEGRSAQSRRRRCASSAPRGLLRAEGGTPSGVVHMSVHRRTVGRRGAAHARAVAQGTRRWPRTRRWAPLVPPWRTVACGEGAAHVVWGCGARTWAVLVGRRAQGPRSSRGPAPSLRRSSRPPPQVMY